MGALCLDALPGLPEIRRGDDLADLLAQSARRLPGGLQATDVLAVAHKVVSKAEGRVVALSDVRPDDRARALAVEHDRDARHVQVILDESAALVRADRGRLIARTHHGFVCANAGVDASNAAGPDELVLLPLDPDASARRLRAELRECLGGAAPAILVTDSFGRAWRQGQCEVAIGCAGLRPLADWRGLPDAAGRTMTASVIATADEVAAACDLVRGKTSREPAVRARGLGHLVEDEDGPGARALIRAREDDLFG